MANPPAPSDLDELTAKLRASQISAQQGASYQPASFHQVHQNTQSNYFGSSYSRQSTSDFQHQLNQGYAGQTSSPQSNWAGERTYGQGLKGQGSRNPNNGQSFYQQRQSTYPPPTRTASLMDYVKGAPRAAPSNVEPHQDRQAGPTGVLPTPPNTRMQDRDGRNFTRQHTFPSHTETFESQPRAPYSPQKGRGQAISTQGEPSQPRQGHSKSFQSPKARTENLVAPEFEVFVLQCQYLDELAASEVPKIAVTPEEVAAKEDFRQELEGICRDVIKTVFPDSLGEINLVPYGSIQSGFATKNSDMDLLFLWKGGPSMTDSSNVEKITEHIEAGLLEAGRGARLISKTRVPVIKVCELPSEDLRLALLAELQKTEEEKEQAKKTQGLEHSEDQAQNDEANDTPELARDREEGDIVSTDQNIRFSSEHNLNISEGAASRNTVSAKQRPWFRERPPGPLDFPNTGVGIQCDIGFTKFLSIYNTHLLRCYAACDPRVKDMVLFVKSWAKQRRINSSYSGTLSSYGWALMVLHFLINIVKPPVLPNLQKLSSNRGSSVPAESRRKFGEYDIEFFDDIEKLRAAERLGQLTRNTDPIGSLLRSFIQYYAQQGAHIIGGGFQWKNDVISIRTMGGIVSKQSKGWIAATSTVDSNGVEVRQRYLLAIECPMEIDHNVARTVHHNGIVAIRDEFRRAYRILTTAAWSKKGHKKPEGLLDPLTEKYEIDPQAGGLAGRVNSIDSGIKPFVT